MFSLADLDLFFFLFSSYVNHSCAPNCVAEVVTFDKEDKIIIISSRRIPKGEEVQCIRKLTTTHSCISP